MLKSKMTSLFALPLLLLLALAAPAALGGCASAQHAQHQQAGSHNKPPDDKSVGHDKHKREADARGERAMGFSQAKTTHHFTLHADGGTIQVEANDAADAESRDRIRAHLAQVARSFAEGVFSKPKEVHAQAPPGIETMRRLRASIKFEYSETERGGRVRISTADPQALAAVHAFLRFQIEDHATGDPTEVVEPR